MTRADKTALILAVIGLGACLLTRALRSPVYSFADKVVLITGGSRGLGLVLARTLMAEGARLAICARNEDELSRAADDLTRAGRSLMIIPCDVTNASQTEATVRAVETYLGPIDVLINNAGTISVGPLSTMTRADFEEALAISFWGAYNMVEAVLPSMRQRQSGRIVNISSIGGRISLPHLVPYSVGKFALYGYSHGLHTELSGDGISVTTVCPGLMRTGSVRQALFKGQHDAEYTWFKVSSSLPMLTVSAEHAALDIIEACRRGDAEVVISVPAQVAVTLQSLFPELIAAVTSLTNQLLPGAENRTDIARAGKECRDLAPGLLTALTDRAAQQNNEIAPNET